MSSPLENRSLPAGGSAKVPAESGSAITNAAASARLVTGRLPSSRPRRRPAARRRSSLSIAADQPPRRHEVALTSPRDVVVEAPVGLERDVDRMAVAVDELQGRGLRIAEDAVDPQHLRQVATVRARGDVDRGLPLHVCRARVPVGGHRGTGDLGSRTVLGDQRDAVSADVGRIRTREIDDVEVLRTERNRDRSAVAQPERERGGTRGLDVTGDDDGIGGAGVIVVRQRGRDRRRVECSAGGTPCSAHARVVGRGELEATPAAREVGEPQRRCARAGHAVGVADIGIQLQRRRHARVDCRDIALGPRSAQAIRRTSWRRARDPRATGARRTRWRACARCDVCGSARR